MTYSFNITNLHNKSSHYIWIEKQVCTLTQRTLSYLGISFALYGIPFQMPDEYFICGPRFYIATEPIYMVYRTTQIHIMQQIKSHWHSTSSACLHCMIELSNPGPAHQSTLLSRNNVDEGRIQSKLQSIETHNPCVGLAQSTIRMPNVPCISCKYYV